MSNAEGVRVELTDRLRSLGLANRPLDRASRPPANVFRPAALRGPQCKPCLHYTEVVLDFLLDLIFPRQCLGCKSFGKFICESCQKTIRFYDKSVFQDIPDVDDTFILAHYDGIIREAVKEIKYRGRFGICQELADLIAKNFRQKFEFDYLVPVPLAPKRLADRGFNQAEKLAHELYKVLCIKYYGHKVLNCLERTRETKPQFDLKYKEREENVKGAFIVRHDTLYIIRNTSVCLVDDVATTGSTISECAKALKKAGAKKVFIICVARD